MSRKLVAGATSATYVSIAFDVLAAICDRGDGHADHDGPLLGPDSDARHRDWRRDRRRLDCTLAGGADRDAGAQPTGERRGADGGDDGRLFDSRGRGAVYYSGNSDRHSRPGAAF